MSTKHYFPSTAANTLVPRALRALVSANPHLTLNELERVVADAHNDPAAVSVIGGGGSGHEPAWSGFVGEGLLSAAACGDIFASPSTKQILAAMHLAPSAQGTILLITNYTGDRLHFGLAAERAKAAGLCAKVAVLPATDDVSIGRSQSNSVGRRGMPGHIFTMKILCAAAARQYTFERCLCIGQAINTQTVSIGSTLDHCHVPGRQHQSIADDVCIVGAGIHNEPGRRTLSPFPSVEELIKQCLELLCDQTDIERAFVQFEDSDKVALLVNNYGGLSALELGALTDEVQAQLASTYQISPCRTLAGAFETSLNAPGFSISLCNISAAARQCQSAPAELLDLFDRSTTAVSWPSIIRPATVAKTITSGHGNSVQNGKDDRHEKQKGFAVDPKVLGKAVRSACLRAISSEPKLTQWDMVMGDGDCGEAVKGLCESILCILDNGGASSGALIPFLEATNTAVDDMGGTLGAILGILLSAFTSALQNAVQSRADDLASPSKLYATALASAVESLKLHTAAREGDRTVMDVLLPFSEAFAQEGDFSAAVSIATERAEATRFLKPKMGRASYVGETTTKQLPDPGAWALYEMLYGLAEGLN